MSGFFCNYFNKFHNTGPQIVNQLATSYINYFEKNIQPLFWHYVCKVVMGVINASKYVKHWSFYKFIRWRYITLGRDVM